MSRRDDIILVDGYNMIGAWPVLAKLKDKGLEEARDKLLDMLADYQGFTGRKVYVIFDAHQVPGLGASYSQHKLNIVFTKEKETADECIERLVSELALRRRDIYVATSDLVEQHVTFGRGALRISARELLIEIVQNRKNIERRLSEDNSQIKRNTLQGNVKPDVLSQLEKWRRGDS
ncbi:NYN domain-containing protein [Paenibacillus protaetiae]|uniref:NYN domain-containing protein n=1 Tax=Paenibacillus protaetiae TaxID=2509456 RepID=A0A4P6EWS2_9BACL|nr:NYN domain-containing protein [Paenibacillus protaetiae]QAY67840.1 NYN domain-containing protein [Paenibacillus protaetiae]